MSKSTRKPKTTNSPKQMESVVITWFKRKMRHDFKSENEVFACSGFSQSPFYFWSALRKDEIFGPESQGLYYWDRILKCQFQKHFGLARKYQQ